MKKFFIIVMLFLLSSNLCTFADSLYLEKETKYQKKIMEMGFKILNANRIDKRVTFSYDTKKVVNAVTYSSSKNVVVYKGILPYFDDDNELAAILCHEISHAIEFDGFFKAVAMSFATKKYEKKADLEAVDLMVNAGYNPVALIVALNKITDEPKGFDRFCSTHPAGTQRLAYVYEYIYKKYPGYLVDNDYKTNIYYQNFLLTSKDAREKIRDRELRKINNKKENI